MLNTLLVIQKVNKNGTVEIFQAFSDSKPFQWTFEVNRKVNDTDNLDYFPFTIRGIHPDKRTPGPETKTKVNNSTIKFIDDYGIPDGSVIAILFPQNFIPDIIKFKDNPYIPAGLVGQVTSKPPGQLQVLYNRLEKRSAIVLHIHEKLLFGVKCIAKKVSDEKFPDHQECMADELFDVSISRQFLNVDSIRTDDLKIINDTINMTNLAEINNLLNEILAALKEGDKAKSQSLLSKFGKLLMNGTSVAGNLTKILDSYYDGGSAFKFIGKVIEYATL